MPVATFPASPKVGVLPFLSLGVLSEQGGEEIAEIPVSVWPATSSSYGPGGRHHTHRGEAHLDYAQDLRRPNRSLEVDGERYKIAAATPAPFMAHVVLELVQTSGRA